VATAEAERSVAAARLPQRAALSPLADATARERALDLAQARGPLQEAFAERLLADPAAVRARVRGTLEQSADAFFDAAWTSVAVQLATDLRLKNDLLKRQGTGAALASVSDAVTLAPDGDSIIVDQLQDNATAAHGTGVTFLPSVFGRPHVMVVHAPGWQPVVQYPVAEASPAGPVSLETVTLRLEAPAHPVRLRLLRPSPVTTEREFSFIGHACAPTAKRASITIPGAISS
jgi:hypothetical protein